MKKVTIYETAFCPYCQMAKSFFKDRNISFERISAEDAEVREELMNKTKMRTVPQIFIGDHFVGGYDQLSSLSEDELKKLLD